MRSPPPDKQTLSSAHCLFFHMIFSLGRRLEWIGAHGLSLEFQCWQTLQICQTVSNEMDFPVLLWSSLNWVMLQVLPTALLLCCAGWFRSGRSTFSCQKGKSIFFFLTKEEAQKYVWKSHWNRTSQTLMKHFSEEKLPLLHKMCRY